MLFDAAVEAERRPTARQIEQLIAGQDTLRPLGQDQQQIEFAGAQMNQGLAR